jgi:HAD superfamily hydrolase (TIGR01549 family)
MTIRAVIFDLGNTLVYFDGQISQVLPQADSELSRALKDCGFEIDAQVFEREFRQQMTAYHRQREYDLIEHSTAAVLERILAKYGYINVPEDSLRSLLARLYAVTQEYWIPENDLLPTIKILHQRGYLMGVISNAGDDADVQTLVNKANIRRYLDFVVSSAAFGIRKPDQRIFQFALDSWGLLPGQVAMVGDTLEADILGARQAGIFGVWITRRVNMAAKQTVRERIQPDAEVESLHALLDLFGEIED